MNLKKFLFFFISIQAIACYCQTVPTHYYHNPTNSGVNNLFFNSGACNKFQFIYTQAEIAAMTTPVTGPINISRIWFRHGGGTSDPSTILSDLVIKMGHTTLTNPTGIFNSNFNAGAPVTVLTSTNYTYTPLIGAAGVPSNNWTFIDLLTPFNYNFTDNLCIEISFSNSSGFIVGNFADNGGIPISQYAGANTATNANGSTARPVFGISGGATPCPSVTATSSQINVTCNGGSDGSATVVASGGTSFTYSWSPSGGSNATATGLSAGNYTCTITNECGNSTTQPFTITETVSYQLNATIIQPICGNNNGCISFAPTPVGTYFYSWPFPTNFTVDSVCNLSPGSYDITINSADGCPIDTTIVLTEPSPFNVIETISPSTCNALDGSISLSTIGGTAPFIYSWSSGGSSTNSLTNVASGNYSVAVTDQNGCSVTENYSVPQINTFDFDVFPSFSSITSGESIQFDATGATSFSWSPSSSLNCNDCSNPIATPIENTIYMIIGENSEGCIDTTYATVNIQEDNFLYAPNTFTPDGDEFNNIFLPCISDSFDPQSYALFIYNGWGELIFQSIDINEGWNGTYNGRLQQNGIFTWKILLKTKDLDDIKEFHGHLLLLK
jgi:gliding motility-associated-like protein